MSQVETRRKGEEEGEEEEWNKKKKKEKQMKEKNKRKERCGRTRGGRNKGQKRTPCAVLLITQAEATSKVEARIPGSFRWVPHHGNRSSNPDALWVPSKKSPYYRWRICTGSTTWTT